jgi:NAD(P)-dependent dehydrogenase (short-subunit alcohol dehydrogenase family)
MPAWYRLLVSAGVEAAFRLQWRGRDEAGSCNWGSVKAGWACVRDLLEHGYEVINVDAARPGEALCPFVEADLTEFGQVLESLSGVDTRHDKIDAVVHLAAIPAPGRHTNAVTFRNNILSTYNVLEAARKLEIRNLVWALSETVLGLPFDQPPPAADLGDRPRTPGGQDIVLQHALVLPPASQAQLGIALDEKAAATASTELLCLRLFAWAALAALARTLSRSETGSIPAASLPLTCTAMHRG